MKMFISVIGLNAAINSLYKRYIFSVNTVIIYSCIKVRISLILLVIFNLNRGQLGPKNKVEPWYVAELF